jgi:hypothetical protein
MRMEMIGGWCISLSGSVEGHVQTLEDMQHSGKPRRLEIFSQTYQFTKRSLFRPLRRWLTIAAHRNNYYHLKITCRQQSDTP